MYNLDILRIMSQSNIVTLSRSTFLSEDMKLHTHLLRSISNHPLLPHHYTELSMDTASQPHSSNHVNYFMQERKQPYIYPAYNNINI